MSEVRVVPAQYSLRQLAVVASTAKEEKKSPGAQIEQ